VDAPDASSVSEIPSVDTPDTPVSIPEPTVPEPTVPEPPKEVSPEDALVVLHLDEHPVLDLEEVTVVVEDFLSDVAEVSDTVSDPVITEIVAHTITVQSGFAVKSADSDTETIPESSEMPFYRYTLEDTETGTTGVLIASGDKRIGASSRILRRKQTTRQWNLLWTSSPTV
jgi:hypothetical protein